MNSMEYSLQVLNEIFPDEQQESLQQQQVDEAQARYESAIVVEARQIAEGSSLKPATKEHLRVVLEWLDGTRVRLNREQPEAQQGVNTPPF
jgi:hypothetical protein